MHKIDCSFIHGQAFAGLESLQISACILLIVMIPCLSLSILLSEAFHSFFCFLLYFARYFLEIAFFTLALQNLHTPYLYL